MLIVVQGAVNMHDRIMLKNALLLCNTADSMFSVFFAFLCFNKVLTTSSVHGRRSVDALRIQVYLYSEVVCSEHS